jgi:hypothetical protein
MPTMRYGLLILLSGLLCCLASAIMAKGETDAAVRITCSDGEVFYLNELETVETNLAALNTDLIIVEKRYYRLSFYRDGRVLKKYPVAIGKLSTPTPVGEWKVINKGVNRGNGFGERWLGLNCPWGIYGIHGTDQPGSIGMMSSHGCIRMHNRNVVELYNLVRIGTPVHVIGDLPRISLRRVLKLKAAGQDVLRLQFALRQKGFDVGPADARYGPTLKKAICKLQIYYGLTPTGIVTSNELNLLNLNE